jgi:hypothetical protein
VAAVGKCGTSCGRRGGSGEAMGTATRRRPWSKRVHRCSDRVADGWTPAVSIFFQFIQNRMINFKNQNPYLAPKITNFCMQIAGDIGNNFLNCAYFKF